LHPYFRDAPSLEEAVTLAIRGLDDRAPTLGYGNVAGRFACYEGWLHDPEVCPVKFEELVSHQQRQATLVRMASFFAERTTGVDLEQTTARMLRNISPERSHTYRQGKSGGWKETFTARQCELFKSVGGELLIQLGYETDHEW
jgi:hypothetical protein